MTKLASTLAVVVLGLVAVGPRVAVIADALVPLVLIVGVVAALLRIVWWRTRG